MHYVFAAMALALLAARGAALYGQYCMVCHGSGAISGGVLPDLRASASSRDREVWLQNIRGARVASGMPDFSEWIVEADAEAIRTYVARAAQVTRDEQPVARR